MNFEFCKKINPFLTLLDFKKALQIAESELKKLPTTVFHKALDKSLLEDADALAFWTESFYDKAGLKKKVKALYFEMNEFDINTDLWYISSFAFGKDGGLKIGDMEWLCDFDTDSRTEIETVFAIDAFEELQTEFDAELNNENLQNARDWCEQIIITRFME